MKIWFRSSSQFEISEVFRKLEAMDDVISDGDRKVTFVDGTNRQIRIKMNPNNINDYPSWLPEPRTEEEKKKAKEEVKSIEAWVYPLPGGARRHGTYHVGSGFRLILGPTIFFAGTPQSHAATIYHELTHKILGTNDHYYEDDCKGVPRNVAITNADNYCLFIREYMKANSMT